MDSSNWRVLRAIGMHTLNSTAAILSFVVLSWLTERGVHTILLLRILEFIEGTVLIVVLLVFAINVIYDLLPEQLRNVITSRFVFA
ncbi:MAG: hypothetical protein DMG32_07800 [Acidobacteria bacterium]|nr:MAG: hypothetical protein DMG32_07800 [Acidobacteriota bacterium]